MWTCTALVFSLSTLVLPSLAETGYDGWLRYAPPSSSSNRHHGVLPSTLYTSNSSDMSPVNSAGQEATMAFDKLFNSTLKSSSFNSSSCKGSGMVITTREAYEEKCGKGSVEDLKELKEDGYYLYSKGDSVKIIGSNERGALYGTFQYLSALAQGNYTKVEKIDNPTNQLRWINQWDNMDGTVMDDVGSLFFGGGTVLEDLDRVSGYGRFLASIGYNAIIVNNVNAEVSTINDTNVPGLGRIADKLRPWGIQMGVSLNFASPQTLGGLPTYDPLNASVIAWWNNKTNQIYDAVPDMVGYLVKADSEGQPGPFTYNRTLVDGANLFARALQPHNGTMVFRAFVYTSQNYSDWRADRCVQPVQYFADLDGQFDDNVVVQIKWGPLDFQVMEPVSPLFAHLPNTNLALEFETTQEYTGQQSHFVYQPELWRTFLDFDMRIDGKHTPVRDIASGKATGRPMGGIAVVGKVGNFTTWSRHDLAMADFYASGRIAWDPTLSSKEIMEEWTRLTFSTEGKVVDTMNSMALDSYYAFRNYSGNHGVGSLTAVYSHYAPDPDSADGPGGSRWFRGYADSIGMDRTVYNGSRLAGQYPSEVASMFESVESTPEDLLLFFHHLPYNHTLSSGDTIIQDFYNRHFDGYDRAAKNVDQWMSLKKYIDEERYDHVYRQLNYQATNAKVFRDSINDWFYNKTQIDDEKHRFDNIAQHRIEAESMTLDGYSIYPVTPFECASNQTAIATTSNSTEGMASTTLTTSGTFDVVIGYYDTVSGISNYTVMLNSQTLGSFAGDREQWDHVASPYVSCDTGTSYTFHMVNITKGDNLTIIGRPQTTGNATAEAAPIDYVELWSK